MCSKKYCSMRFCLGFVCVFTRWLCDVHFWLGVVAKKSMKNTERSDHSCLSSSSSQQPAAIKWVLGRPWATSLLLPGLPLSLGPWLLGFTNHEEPGCWDSWLQGSPMSSEPLQWSQGRSLGALQGFRQMVAITCAFPTGALRWIFHETLPGALKGQVAWSPRPTSTWGWM